MSRPAACTFLSCLLITAAGVTPGLAKDYLLTGAKPDQLVLVDPAAHKVEKSCQVPDAGTGLLTIVPSPDARTAYVITNHWESVSGIDLDSCEQVFRADFSSGDERVKAPFGMDISPDGRELFVIQSPVRLKLGEYEVQPTRIAVYDTASGVGAEPVRTFEVPRRIGMLMTSNDGSKLYALSWDLYVLDPQTGEEIGRHPLRNWQRDNYGEPDVLDAWPQWDATDIFSSPYFVMRTDVDPGAADAFKTGLVTLDLKTGEFETKDFENTSVIIFSTVINPVRRRIEMPNGADQVLASLRLIQR
jgi:quinohemoprotein amine dehydrogenase beta subunit